MCYRPRTIHELITIDVIVLYRFSVLSGEGQVGRPGSSDRVTTVLHRT